MPILGDVSGRFANFSFTFRFRIRVVMGKSLDSPEKRQCPKNVEKMSKNCPEGWKTQFLDIFRTIFAYVVDAFVW